MSDPEISIVMPVYNSENTIGMAIRSIVAQNMSGWELLVIDDASSDHSIDRVTEFNDRRIRIIRNESNLGLASSLNRGIDAAHGRYLARMDSDDLAYPDRLQKQYEYLEANPEVDLVGSKVLVFAGQGEALGILVPPKNHRKIELGSGRGAFPLYHPAWLGKTEWFRKHKYDPVFRKAQDYELLLRASTISRYANVQEILLGYRAQERRLANRLITRCYVVRALFKTWRHKGNITLLVIGALITCLKGLQDILLVVFQRNMTGTRWLVGIQTEDRASWAELWQRFSN